MLPLCMRGGKLLSMMRALVQPLVTLSNKRLIVRKLFLGDIYHLYLMARQIDLPLMSITLNLGNVHIYENNEERTKQLLNGNEDVKFDLNV